MYAVWTSFFARYFPNPHIQFADHYLTSFREVIQLPKNITCKSDNLVYLITCKTCSLQYVGQTYRSIAQRFQGHFNDITSNRHWKAVGEHFNKPNHNGWSDCEISVLYFCSVNPGKPNDINQRALKIRKNLERHWQFQLQTLSPKGLNRLEE